MARHRTAAIMPRATAGPWRTGSAATIPRWIVRAIQATPAEAIAGEAAETVVEATNAIRPAQTIDFLIYRNSSFLDSFQSVSRTSLESFEKTGFPFASSRGLTFSLAKHNR